MSGHSSNISVSLREVLKLFALLVFLQSLVQFAIEYLLFTDELLFKQLESQISADRILKYVNARNYWKWLSYLIIPLFLFVKLYLISACISIGALLFKNEITLTKIFYIVTISEFVFFISHVIKILYFFIFHPNYTLEELQYFSPLSIASIYDFSQYEYGLIYPMQILSVFEILYWLALSYQLKDILNRNLVGSLGFVASTYGVGLLLWVIFVMFITVSLT